MPRIVESYVGLLLRLSRLREAVVSIKSDEDFGVRKIEQVLKHRSGNLETVIKGPPSPFLPQDNRKVNNLYEGRGGILFASN